MKLHELEALANSICEELNNKTTKMRRLITAYARIINAREPSQFERMPCAYADEDGHWDNTYPPKQIYKDHTGPRLFEIISESTKDIATSTGFYYSWKRVTEDPGLYVAPDGELYGCTQTGTGEYSGFAAYPGDCRVDVTLEWAPLIDDEITFDRLQKAERELRAIAFPHVAASQAVEQNR